MNDETMEHNGTGTGQGMLRFPSLDTGDLVLAAARAVEGGQVSLSLVHQMDGELEIFMDPANAEELALALARAADGARESAEEDEE